MASGERRKEAPEMMFPITVEISPVPAGVERLVVTAKLDKVPYAVAYVEPAGPPAATVVPDHTGAAALKAVLEAAFPGARVAVAVRTVAPAVVEAVAAAVAPEAAAAAA
jgi:hypothetical protein